MRIAVVLVAALASAGALWACGGSSRSSTSASAASHGNASYGTLLDAGTHLLRLGNVSAAEQLFRQAIAKNPRGAVAHYDLGVIYQQMADRHDAVVQYRRALALDPRYVPALFNQAILTAAVNPPLAIFYYRRVIALQPDAPTAYLNLGLLENGARGSRSLAVRDLRRAVRLDPQLARQIPPALRGEVLSAIRRPRSSATKHRKG